MCSRLFRQLKSNRKTAYTALWIFLTVALLVVLVILFPRIVDDALSPISKTLRNNLSDVEIAAVLIAGIIVLPLLFLPYYPFVWVVAPAMSFWACFLVTVFASAVSMMLMYTMGKSVLHVRAQRWVQKSDVLKAVIVSVDRVGPFKTQILLRLSLVPFVIVNYASSVPESMTPVIYITASVIGWAPRNAIFVYFGKNLKGIAALLSGKSMPTSQLVVNTVILVISLAVIIGGFLLARAAFRQIQQQAEGDKDEEAAAAAAQHPHQNSSSSDVAVGVVASAPMPAPLPSGGLSVAAVAVGDAVGAAAVLHRQT